jgi:hypothetical protein
MLACVRDRVDNDLLRSNIPARRRFRLYLSHLEWSRAHVTAMNEKVRSILTGTTVLWMGAAVALLLGLVTDGVK